MNNKHWQTNLCTAVVLSVLALLPIKSTLADEKEDKKGMNAMLQPWTGPHGGVPPWHLVRPDQFVAAFDAAIATSRKEIDALANNPEPPTFANTIKGLENAGRTLTRLQNIFGVYTSNLNVGPIPD